MMRTIAESAAALAAVVLLIAGRAYATTFDDGLVHTADGTGPFDGITLNSATTLNVVNGADVLGADATGSFAQDGVTSSNNSPVNVYGGSVRGGEQQFYSGFGGNGVRSTAGTISISDGFVRGGDNSYANFGGFAGPGVSVSTGSLYVTGGTIRGGDRLGDGFGGTGIDANDSYVSISGGVIQGGDNPGGNLGGDGLQVRGTSTGEVTGGTFTAGNDGWALQTRHTASLIITGGTFSGPISASEDSIISIYGYGLSFSGVNGSLLTGTLMDQTPISVPASVFANAQLLLYQVPEPATLSLVAVGLAGLLAGGRRRRSHVGLSR